jgi:ankyrin repeat protein
LHRAAEDGHDGAAKVLLDGGIKVDLKDGAGTTPLMIAAAASHPQVVQLLLKAGADIDLTNRQQETALHRALGTQHLLKDVEGDEIVTRVMIPLPRIFETVRLLLEAGANPRVRSTYEETPIQLVETLVRLTREFKALAKLVKAAKQQTAK